MDTIRILIVDDHILFRTGVVTLIKSEPGMEVVGEAVNGEEAIELAEILKPNVILIDLVMPKMDGIQAIQRIHQKDPSIRFLVMSTFGEKKDVIASIRAGALGYLLKDSTPNQLLQAIRDLSDGKSTLHPLVASILMQDLIEPEEEEIDEPKSDPIDLLTQREHEVFDMVIQGKSNDEIASECGISKRTVNNHINGILRKLSISNRAQIVLFAVQKGIVSVQPSSSV